jgi:multidrug efflux system outer membrane protein
MWETEGAANWNIFNMSQIDSIKISRAQETQAEASLRQASAALRYNLATAFYQVLYDQENIEVSINVLAMRDTSSQLVTLRYESGTGYKGDMLTAKAELLQARADLAQAKRSLRADQRVLNQQLGIDEFTVIGVTSAFTVHDPGDLPLDFEPVLSKRPDVMLQQAVVRSAQLNLAQAKSSLWPILSASYLLYNAGPKEFQAPRSGWGLNLSYPLFGGGPTATYYAVAAAKSSLEQAAQNLRMVREQALSNIESVWSNFEGAIDQTKVQAALLEAARVRNDEADIRYSSGLLTYDNWEIIASARISQEHTALQSQLTALNAEAAWAQALGKQLEE